MSSNKRFRVDDESKSLETVFYNKGSCIDWARAQNKIEDQFRINGVFDFIKSPDNYIQPEGDISLIEIPEKQLEMTEPTYEKIVKQQLEKDEENWLTIYDLKRKEIENSTFSQAQKKKFLFNLKLDYHDRVEKKSINETKYAHELTSMKLKYDEQLRKFEKEQATALGIFKKCISSSVLYTVKNELNSLKLRTAWKKLCIQNSTGNNDEYIEFGLIKNITMIKYDGKDINKHLNQFSILYDQLTEFGIIFPEKLMKAFMVNSIKDSGYYSDELHTVIDHCVCNKLPYHILVSMLQSANSRDRINKQILKLNNDTSNKTHKSVALNVSNVSSSEVINNKNDNDHNEVSDDDNNDNYSNDNEDENND